VEQGRETMILLIQASMLELVSADSCSCLDMLLLTHRGLSGPPCNGC